ncbi:MAG: hypothetical protein DCF32_14215 [Leptolyngbya sp.]|nr:MAG: hypothetical protein DCF32_14215 [Leptolyngbya sp.]
MSSSSRGFLASPEGLKLLQAAKAERGRTFAAIGKNTPFSKLQFLPKNAEAVTQWGDRDAAWLNVETGIKRVVESLRGANRL